MNNLTLEFLERFLIHLAFLLILVRALYYPVRRNNDLSFSYLMFGVVVFLLVHTLKGSSISLGFGFGLFAVFGVLRYRTETISSRDLTYLFVVIGLATINALPTFQLQEFLVVNVLFVLSAALAQSRLFASRESQQRILYERVQLLVPERRDELHADLEQRLGRPVLRVEIGEVDFLRDTVVLQVVMPNREDIMPLGENQRFGRFR